jgi:hypothetical protein
MFRYGDFTMRKVLANTSLVEATEFDDTIIIQPDIEKVRYELERLFIAGREEFFKDGMESRFSKGLILAIEKYGEIAIAVISDLILAERVSSEVASEALRWIGDIDDNSTYERRFNLLKESLKCSSPRVRDGAGLGLSFMDDPSAIDSLKEAILKEQSKLLRRNMIQVLEQLEGEF